MPCHVPCGTQCRTTVVKHDNLSFFRISLMCFSNTQTALLSAFVHAGPSDAVVLCCLHARLPGNSHPRVYCGRHVQATCEQKSRLETAVISAGRQLKLVTAQRDNLI